MPLINYETTENHNNEPIQKPRNQHTLLAGKLAAGCWLAGWLADWLADWLGGWGWLGGCWLSGQ